MAKEFTFNANNHRYFLDGKPLTGVTTILGVIAKPALVPWAAKMTVEYIKKNCVGDVENVYVCNNEQLEEAKNAHRAKKEAAADFGTVVHDKIEGYIRWCIDNNNGAPTDQYEFDLTGTGLTPAKVTRVEVNLNDFVAWAQENVGTFLESEARLYSENHWYAGTVDIIYRDKDGNTWIADIKTSGAVYPEYYAQMGGYDIAYEEMNGNQNIYGYLVIRLDKEKGDMELVGFNDTAMCREYFLHALGLYRITNNLKI